MGLHLKKPSETKQNKIPPKLLINKVLRIWISESGLVIFHPYLLISIPQLEIIFPVTISLLCLFVHV